jgi:hypothetical protein
MPLLTHVWKTTVSVPGLPSLPGDDPITITGDVDTPISTDVPAGQVGHIAGLSIDKTKVNSLVLQSSGTGLTTDVTVSTNANDSPLVGDVFVMAPKKSVGWHNQMDQALFPLPITHNITDIFIDNTLGTVTANFRGAFLLSL